MRANFRNGTLVSAVVEEVCFGPIPKVELPRLGNGGTGWHEAKNVLGMRA